jgi:hypothetical protein
MPWIRNGRTPALAGAALLAGLIALPAAPPAVAAEDSAEARQIVERADRANTPPAMVETMKMVLTDEGGHPFERRLRLWTRKGEGGDSELMRFLAPDEIRGAGLLTIEHRGAEDDQWFYLPATRKIRRIAGANRRNRFLGTEFLYEDLQGYHPEDYTFRLLPGKTVDGEPCHVVEALPRAGARSAYSRKVLFLGQRTLVLRRAELYGEDGSEIKVITAGGVEEVLPGIFLPNHVLVENLVDGRRTSLDTLDRELPDSLPAETFSQRNLRRRLRPDER